MNTRFVFGFALVAVLALTAGCSADGSLSMQPVDDAGLAAEASDELPDDQTGDDRSVVRRAIENGSATVVAQDPPVDEQLPTRHEGRFYAVNYTEAGTEPAHRVTVEVDYNGTADGSVVAYEDLPAVDRETLDGALGRGDVVENRLQPGYDFGTSAVYEESEAASSAFVGDWAHDAVRYEGETYPVSVDVEETTLTVYRYEATTVANSSEAYARQLRDRYEFELSGLSEAERSVVDEALNDTKYLESTDNEGFASLVERFRSQDAVTETEYDGRFVVRYEGQLYWVTVNYGSYAENGEGGSSAGAESEQ
jgi:hypothetical protein